MAYWESELLDHPALSFFWPCIHRLRPRSSSTWREQSIPSTLSDAVIVSIKELVCQTQFSIPTRMSVNNTMHSVLLSLLYSKWRKAMCNTLAKAFLCWEGVEGTRTHTVLLQNPYCLPQTFPLSCLTRQCLTFLKRSLRKLQWSLILNISLGNKEKAQ